MNEVLFKNLGINKTDYYNSVSLLSRLGDYYRSELRRIDENEIYADPQNYVDVYHFLKKEFGNDFNGKKILEVGSGTGIFLSVLSQMGAEVHGIDRRNLGDLPGKNGVNLYRDDVRCIDYNLFGNVDAVISRAFFEHPMFSNLGEIELLFKSKLPKTFHIHQTHDNTLSYVDWKKLNLDMKQIKTQSILYPYVYYMNSRSI